MTIESLRKFLAWCTVFNLAVLTAWWLMFMVARDWIHGLHGKWFRLPAETFDALHYGGMMGFKVAIFLFNLVPYLVLRIFF